MISFTKRGRKGSPFVKRASSGPSPFTKKSDRDVGGTVGPISGGSSSESISSSSQASSARQALDGMSIGK